MVFHTLQYSAAARGGVSAKHPPSPLMSTFGGRNEGKKGLFYDIYTGWKY